MLELATRNALVVMSAGSGWLALNQFFGPDEGNIGNVVSIAVYLTFIAIAAIGVFFVNAMAESQETSKHSSWWKAGAAGVAAYVFVVGVDDVFLRGTKADLTGASVALALAAGSGVASYFLS